jgi:hypothetical protein
MYSIKEITYLISLSPEGKLKENSSIRWSRVMFKFEIELTVYIRMLAYSVTALLIYFVSMTFVVMLDGRID